MTEPTDQDRYPTLSEAGRRILRYMREHPCAPLFRNQSGNRLTGEDIAALLLFEQKVLAARPGWPPRQEPAWLKAFVREVFEDVPYYRAYGSPPSDFRQLPIVSRADFAVDIARFVPDSLPLERLINFRTTGTTGHPLLVPSHPQVAGRYLAFHKRAMRRFGIELQHGRGQVGVILLGHQRRCFTYVSVTPTMGESGLAKINLHSADWRRPDDRGRYLDAMAPEVLAGDPISLSELLRIHTTFQPRALFNVSMMLGAGLRARLEARFSCPVLDVYSMNEVGPVAVFDPTLGGHLLLQDRLYIEILDHEGLPVGEGERGEITVTGGFNFCLPLLRYRTGDHAALVHTPEGPVLQGLIGRAPVRFRHAQGHWLNNIDVSHALGHLPLSHYGLHQHADGALQLRLPANAMTLADAARRALGELLGDWSLEILPIEAEDKIVQYSCEFDGALA